MAGISDGRHSPEPSRDWARRWARIALLTALGGGLANCAGPQVTGKRDDSEARYGVKSSPRVIADGEPIPKGGGRAMVGKPYVIAGRTYVPTTSGYRKEGWASWYGSDFHGRLTANGEVFDRQSVAAAHPTLPLPSYVRVTNIVNKRSMVVRVNDRGPYERDRIIDVSENVAVALDFRRRGTARVKIDYLGKASTNGSDDDVLLATLATDGSPASFSNRKQMLADLKTTPEPRQSPARVMLAAVTGTEAAPAPAAAPKPAPLTLASAPGASDGADEDDETVAHPLPPDRPGARIRLADAGAAVPAVLDPALAASPLPPQRPKGGLAD